MPKITYIEHNGKEHVVDVPEGWSVMEGSHAVKPQGEVGPTPIQPPVVEYTHVEGRSVTGGHFYYGDRLPELKGAYLYGDWMTGKIWGLRHDGERLTVEEISDLNLDAYLVTLSACESALGAGHLSDVPEGDEWVGFSQAFLAAGTSTVIATLWMIDDVISRDFMIAFYAELGSAGKARALAKVQRQFIRDSHTTHPFYWAPFVAIGDPL